MQISFFNSCESEFIKTLNVFICKIQTGSSATSYIVLITIHDECISGSLPTRQSGSRTSSTVSPEKATVLLLSVLNHTHFDRRLPWFSKIRNVSHLLCYAACCYASQVVSWKTTWRIGNSITPATDQHHRANVDGYWTGFLSFWHPLHYTDWVRFAYAKLTATGWRSCTRFKLVGGDDQNLPRAHIHKAMGSEKNGSINLHNIPIVNALTAIGPALIDLFNVFHATFQWGSPMQFN